MAFVAERNLREGNMEQDLRAFLKTTGVAGAAALGGATALSGLAPSVAQAATSAGEQQDLPKSMTFATLRRSGGYGLGLRTDRGVLDVAAAEKDFSAGAPTTITA